MSSEITITVEQLAVSYATRQILSNVSFEVASGNIAGIVGPNGAGKSTLLKAMVQLLPRTHGRVRFQGKPFSQVRGHIAYLPQRTEVDWNFPIRVCDVVRQGAWVRQHAARRWSGGLSLSRIRKQQQVRVEAALDQVGMSAYASTHLGELSGGQQQRVFLARALAQEASIFLLDEPFAGVDIASEQRIFAVLQRLRADGATVVLVYHNLSQAAALFDQIVLLNGHVVAAGTPAQALTTENLQQAYGGSEPFLPPIPGRLLTQQSAQFTEVGSWSFS